MITLFEQEIIDYFKPLNLKSVIVAFSGGSDSTALLHCLIQHRSTLSFDLSVCHVNHHIRGDFADRDAEFCKQFCASYDIPFYLKDVDVPAYAKKHGESIESAARLLRYDALFSLADGLSIDTVLTAHHKEDKVETFFIKLFKGGSILNSSGFSYDTKRLKRPLLGVNKNNIVEYIEQNQLYHIEDETNQSFDHLRNWVRHQIVTPIKDKNASYFDHILQFQEESSLFKDYLEQKTASLLIDDSDEMTETISRTSFNQLHLIEKKYILSKLLSKYFRLEHRHIDEVLKIVDGAASKRISLPNNLLVEVSYDQIRFLNANVIKSFNISVEGGKGEFFISHLNKKVLLNGFSDKDILIIRNRRNGDRFINKKLKDIFIDKKIELFIRDTSILLENNSKVVWVENISTNNDQITVCNRGCI